MRTLSLVSFNIAIVTVVISASIEITAQPAPQRALASRSTEGDTLIRAASTQTNLRLTVLWSLAPGSRTYLLSDTDAQGRTPLYRSIGYNAKSNQLCLVSRTGPAAGLTVNVLDATTGADLAPGGYRLKTDGITGGSINLLSVDVAEDGSIYACNMDTSATTAPANFKLYRWANAASNTLPALVFTGEPANESITLRWGDTMDVRGSGTNTQVIIDNQNSSARYMAVLTPTDSTLSTFTSKFFSLKNDDGGTIIGRSLEFGKGDTFWQKRKGTPLVQSSFDLSLASPNNISPVLATYTNFPASLGPVGLDLSRNLLAGLNFSGSTTAPDTLDLYDVADFSNPALLARYNFPINAKPNGNFIGQIFFAGDRVFALDGNNGILAFSIDRGAQSAPLFLTHPKNLRLVAGGSGSLSASTGEPASYQWLLNGTNIAGATNSIFTMTNAALSSAGTYRVTASNSAGSATSSNATVTVFPVASQYALSQLWSLAPDDRPYLLPDADGQGRTPLYRSIAHNGLSNQVYIISRTGPAVGLAINVLNATTGADLYELNTDGISGGSIILLAIAASQDGSLYAANMDTSGTAAPAAYNLYRWPTSDPARPPQLVFSGEPASQSTPVRWGDTMDVRGKGASTEIIIDSNQGTFATVLTPVDQSMAAFTNRFFSEFYPQPPIGRSLQFGEGNTFWQKRSGSRLQLTSYDLAKQTSSVLTNYQNFPTSLGPVAIDSARHLLAGIHFSESTPSPDTLDLYEISDPNTPMLVAKYDFPVNSHPNGNLIGQVVFAANKVYAVDGNNGVMAFSIMPPTLVVDEFPPTLGISRSGSSITLSWPNAGFILQTATSLTPSVNWTDISNATQTSLTESVAGTAKFYRLRKGP